MLLITPEIKIPYAEFELSYARSSGPGGQNVNKVNSKALLRWNVHESPSISLDIRARIMAKLASQITQDGEILVASDRFRDQIRNREDCFQKFKELIAWATSIPKKRKKTKPTYSSQNKAKNLKKRHSEKKNARRFKADS